ncbi:MAG: glycoside hydrolase family 15 protein [Myxococcota bacterium]
MNSAPSLELAVIGNCTWAGLLDERARLVWGCLPRFDSDPVFCALLRGDDRESGVFAIDLLDFAASEQRYDGNTAILHTILRDRHGSAIEITDFAPRFANFGRTYRPTMIMRRVRPIAGEPRIRILLRPLGNYGREVPETTRGSNHVRWVTPGITLRLTTDAPTSYAADATPFVLTDTIHLVLGPDETLGSAIGSTFREYEERTREHWVEWSRGLSIPFEWQEAVIRAAITLKLCSFEETGAIVAALTTSIPEAPGTIRNWDYRYCWIRDAYFVIHALNRLGATRTLEGYLGYLGNLIAGASRGLQPVYGIGLERELGERVEPGLLGYRAMGPVRIGNQAYEHVQNDVYGSAVLAATQSFFDRRLRHPGSDRLFKMLEALGEQAIAVWDQPDAGLWELRTRARVHTFSAVMCWAACDRLARIAVQTGRDDSARRWRARAEKLHAAISRQASREGGPFTGSFGGDEVDASLLLLEQVGFVRADDPRFVATIAAVEKELRSGPYLFRYRRPDDFGMPETAFNVCTFWYIDALAACGRTDEARALFENMLARRNSVGLLSEDLEPETGELWGNFPQTYSMVGLINSAMRLSRSWEDAF